jgi:hypothetical protein
VGDGIADDGPAIRAAIASLPGGVGRIRLGKIHKVKPAVGDMGRTAIYLPTKVRMSGNGVGGTVIIPGQANMVCIRATGLNGAGDNIQIDNPYGYADVEAISLAPIHEAATDVHTDVEFNNFTNFSIRNVDEAVILQCGPRIEGTDSYCYHNNFVNFDVRNCKRGLWLKAPPTELGSGCNRNNFVNWRIGESGSNTGVQIDAGDTNGFDGLALEGIQSTDGPNEVPTGIKIAYNTDSYGCTDNYFKDLTIEACTRDVDNDNDRTMFIGWFGTGTYYSPSGRPLAVDIRSSGISGKAIGTNRPPQWLGDFFIKNGNARVGATVEVAGEPEVFLDTPGNYGTFSLYQNGVKKWSIGTLASGAQHITMFNADGVKIAQFREDGVFMPFQSETPPPHQVGGYYYDLTLKKACIGGETDWETVTSA